MICADDELITQKVVSPLLHGLSQCPKLFGISGHLLSEGGQLFTEICYRVFLLERYNANCHFTSVGLNDKQNCKVVKHQNERRGQS